jgi:hypothetical protein
MIHAQLKLIRRFAGTAAVAALAAAALAMPVAAQTDATPQRAPETPTEPTAVDDATLKSFAVAALAVQRIDESYQPLLQQAEGPNAQEKLRQQASSEMATAIRENGLTVQQYRQIYVLAQTDTQVATKVNGYIEQAR